MCAGMCAREGRQTFVKFDGRNSPSFFCGDTGHRPPKLGKLNPPTWSSAAEFQPAPGEPTPERNAQQLFSRFRFGQWSSPWRWLEFLAADPVGGCSSLTRGGWPRVPQKNDGEFLPSKLDERSLPSTGHTFPRTTFLAFAQFIG